MNYPSSYYSYKSSLSLSKQLTRNTALILEKCRKEYKEIKKSTGSSQNESLYHLLRMELICYQMIV
ncbi:hypothetical protein pb186bvf_016936 [Paramecium bursaria]